MMVISSKSRTQYVQNPWTYWGRIESMSSCIFLKNGLSCQPSFFFTNYLLNVMQCIYFVHVSILSNVPWMFIV